MEKGSYAFMTEERRRASKTRKIFYICMIAVLGLAVGTLLFWLINGKTFRREEHADTCYGVHDSERFNCHPEPGVTEQECTSRGCCYKPASDQQVQDFDLINSSYLGVPSCYFPKDFAGYDVNVTKKGDDKLVAELTRLKQSGFAGDVKRVQLEVTYIDDSSLRVKLTDADSSRFEPQVPVHFQVAKRNKPLYDLNLDSDGLLTVTRKASGAIVFKTKLAQLIFSDQFLQLTTSTASSYLYGLGEHKEGILKSFNYMRFTLFNQGDLPVPNRNLYGSHPFYLLLEPDGSANGVFLLNSNAMDVFLQPTPAVTFRPIGGILDFFIMLGPTPENVISQYTGIVGRSFMPPYWSLGFQLCKYGYFSLENTQKALQRNLDAGVPIDVQWHDIDFMNRNLDFTYNEVDFKGLPEFVKDLHNKGMHYIAMFSPGVSNTEPNGTYPPYDDGLKKDLFVKDYEGHYIEAKVWNTNYTVFPDFSNPLTPPYWMDRFREFHAKLDFDGAWIDMNEPLNFMNGSQFGCPNHTLEDPVYLPGHPYPLRTLTICMTAKHHTGPHYNEHNLVAYREASATYQALKDVRKKRPFIISRATFSGQGVHSGHWSGDITSNWEDMRYTIPSMLIFNMYGMPMIGSDICGFRLNTSMDLCTRWQALGAFYPFSRNHNDFDTVEQDPAAMGSTVLEATKSALNTRYYLLPYLYTLFHKSHVYGETVVRPLFFEFPNDVNVYSINEEFLWGPALLIIPALYEGINTVKGYLPKGIWYDFNSGKKSESSGESVTLETNLTSINLFVRGGYVIPLQLPGNTTTESRLKDFELMVAVDENKTASGILYWDDGDSLDTYENGNYNQIEFIAENSSFSSSVKKYGYDTSMNLNKIILYGLEGPSNVTINGEPATYLYVKPVLTITTTGLTLKQEFHVTWY